MNDEAYRDELIEKARHALETDGVVPFDLYAEMLNAGLDVRALELSFALGYPELFKNGT